jgi:putative NADH-flavin reductase
VLIQRCGIQVLGELPVQRTQSLVAMVRAKHKIAVAAAVIEAADLVELDGERLRLETG